MAMSPNGYGAWHVFWLCWFAVSFTSFLTVEVYALATDWRRTLSASVWDLIDYKEGQSIHQWSVGHYWFIGIMFLLFVWLLFHFGLGWWR